MLVPLGAKWTGISRDNLQNCENANLSPVTPFGSRTIGRLCLDTCAIIGIHNPARFVEAQRSALEKLIELYHQGKVALAQTDTVGVERDKVPLVQTDAVGFEQEEGELVALQRRLESVGLLIVHGPRITGHSKMETSVAASPEDHTRIERVLEIVHPQAVDHSDPSDNDVRDAMHIATAVRYCYQGFVTTDKAVLKAAKTIATEFGGFQLMLPSQAVDWVTEKVARHEQSNVLRAEQMKKIQ